MLILSAAYESYLQPLIEQKQLEALFIRTIEFLKWSADISPPLKKDMQMLEQLQAKLFPRNDLKLLSSEAQPAKLTS